MTSYAGSEYSVSEPEVPWRTETIFVNASNAPLGPKGRDRTGKTLPVASPGWEPVVVDLEEADPDVDDSEMSALAGNLGRTSLSRR
jgi:hypothetical protein